MKKTVITHHECDSILILNHRETSIIIAALRLWQDGDIRKVAKDWHRLEALQAIASNEDRHDALDENEIDILIEDKINLAEPRIGTPAEMIVSLAGGLITEIAGMPENSIANVRDYDIQGESPFEDGTDVLRSGFHTDTDGLIYRLAIHLPDGSTEDNFAAGLFGVVHEHDYGSSVYLCRASSQPSEDAVIKALGIDFEPHREEYLTVTPVSNSEIPTITETTPAVDAVAEVRTAHNFYRHEDCPAWIQATHKDTIEWDDPDCDSAHNDKCPACNAEIEPYKTVWSDDDDDPSAEIPKPKISDAMAMQMKHPGEYVEFEIDTNGHLKITLTPAGGLFLMERLTPESERQLKEPGMEFPRELFWDRDQTSILWDLLESILVNSDWELLSDIQVGQLGHLTSAPMITYGLETTDDGDAVKADYTFWYPDYAVKSELEELMRDGFVTFSNGDI